MHTSNDDGAGSKRCGKVAAGQSSRPPRTLYSQSLGIGLSLKSIHCFLIVNQMFCPKRTVQTQCHARTYFIYVNEKHPVPDAGRRSTVTEGGCPTNRQGCWGVDLGGRDPRLAVKKGFIQD